MGRLIPSPAVAGLVFGRVSTHGLGGFRVFGLRV